MTRQRGQRPQRPIKGFRPGKEPPELRKQLARQQFGDMTPAQTRLVELFADRTPEEARALVRRWTISLLAGAIAMAILAVALFFWSTIAGIMALVVAVVLLVLWIRLHRQRQAFEAMADAVSRQGGGKKRKR